MINTAIILICASSYPPFLSADGTMRIKNSEDLASAGNKV